MFREFAGCGWRPKPPPVNRMEPEPRAIYTVESPAPQISHIVRCRLTPYLGDLGDLATEQVRFYSRTQRRVDLRQGLVFHTETQRRTRPSVGRSEPGRLRLYLLECCLDALLQCESALELEIRYLDSFDMNGFTCPPSGVFACNNLIVGSLKAIF